MNLHRARPEVPPSVSEEEGREAWIARFRAVRGVSAELAAHLAPEDQVAQAMPDASPTKWHLAHTTWFFETLVLERHAPRYQPFDPHFRVLFNFYYNSVGEQYTRAERGLLSRPSLDEVRDYRRHVDTRMLALLNDPTFVEAARVFAKLIMHEGGETTAGRLNFAFLRAVSRPPDAEERAILERLISQSLAQFRLAVQIKFAQYIAHVGFYRLRGYKKVCRDLPVGVVHAGQGCDLLLTRCQAAPASQVFPCGAPLGQRKGE